MDELDNSNESQEVAEEQQVESTDTRDIIERELEKAEQPQQETQPQQDQEEKPRSTAFNSWKKEAAQELEKLPEHVQKHIIERETQFHKGLEQYREAANFAKTIDKSISPFKDYLNEMQVTPDVAFQNLLKTEHTLRRGSPQEKIEMMQKLVHDYQIDLGTLINTPFDPNYMNLKSQLEWTKSQLESSNDFRQSHEDAQIQSTIADFGQQHEHFEEVRTTMADLLEKGLANNLDDAYVKAIRLNDDVFAKVQTKQQANSKTSQLNQANQAAKAARQSAVQIKGSPIGVKNQAAPSSTEDAVRQAMISLGL